MAWRATRSWRFEYVHTLKHGFGLNVIECAFSKMARTFLCLIRVISVDKLKARIYKGIGGVEGHADRLPLEQGQPRGRSRICLGIVGTV